MNYKKKYEMAKTNTERTEIIRSAKRLVIETSIRVLESGATKFLIEGSDGPIQLMGPSGEEIKGWLGRAQAIKRMKEELKKEGPTSLSLINNTLIMADAYSKGITIVNEGA